MITPQSMIELLGSLEEPPARAPAGRPRSRYDERMGWRVLYVSSMGSDFNYDFGVADTDDEIEGPPSGTTCT